MDIGSHEHFLQEYFYPGKTSSNAKLDYIIIQANVKENFEKKWTAELGKNTLRSDNKFENIRVEKRLIRD